MASAFRHDSPERISMTRFFVLLLAMTNFVFAADPVDAVREALKVGDRERSNKTQLPSSVTLRTN